VPHNARPFRIEAWRKNLLRQIGYRLWAVIFSWAFRCRCARLRRTSENWHGCWRG
jgi:hypothetical protein